jgi:hypothetical protein
VEVDHTAAAGAAVRTVVAVGTAAVAGKKIGNGSYFRRLPIWNIT